MGRISRGVLVSCVCASVVAAALVGAAAASAKTLYAAPSGIGAVCELAAPCSPEEGVRRSVDGDTVLLAPGDYKVSFSGMEIPDEIQFGGAPGASAATVLETGVSSSITLQQGSHATVHDLTIVGQAGLHLESGTAERVYVKYEGLAPETAACQIKMEATEEVLLRNSVCWAVNGTGEEGESVATGSSAVRVEAVDEGVVGTGTLRNVTAIATTTAGSALFGAAANDARLVLNAGNVIARAASRPDVVSNIVRPGIPKAAVTLAHSNFGTVESDGSSATVTEPGINGNQTALPLFVNAPLGDFREAAGSPTIDGGLVDPLVGTTAIDGSPRSRAGCFGATPTPDIGAYEFTAVANCPPPPPPPAPPVGPPPHFFKIVEVKLNKKTGTGFVTVEVPAAGSLTMTGSGVKEVRRSPNEAGLLRLPIKPWAISVVRLTETGKARVHLKVTFSRAGGPSARRAKSVVLQLNR